MEKVVVIMGSKHDQEKVEPAIEVLKEFSIETGVYCISAHRAPDGLAQFIKKLNESGFTKVVIAAAGLSAALPGVIAAKTTIPVIGLPLGGSPLNGQEALYSMAEMPPGIPVATVGINGAKNAGLMAVRIVANEYPGIGLALERYNEAQAKKSLADNDKIHEYYSKLAGKETTVEQAAGKGSSKRKSSASNEQSQSYEPISGWNPEDMF